MLRANCTLGIELERPDRRYQAGERITGRVRVEASDTVKCDGLTLTCQWRTHGKGNRVSGPPGVIQLFTGEWRPGTYTYDFDLACPAFPLSYQGKILNIDWFLDARADVPWAIDAQSSTDFHVALPPSTEAQVSTTSTPTQSTSITGSVIGMLLLIPFALVGVYLVVEGMNGDSGALVFALLWFAALSLMFALMLKRLLSRRAFARFDTRIDRHEAGHLVVHNRYDTTKLVNQLRFTLVAEEVVVEGSGTDERTYREQVYSQLETVHVGRRGEHSCQVALTLPDPSRVGWSFEATDNKLHWYVQVDCDIENWPDLCESFELSVRPQAVVEGRG